MRYYKANWRESWDRWLWNCPGIGGLLQSAGCILFANTLATLLAAGIPLMSGLPTSLLILNNHHAQARLLAAVVLIKQGHSFSYALQQTQLFPQLAMQMWQIGEHTGKLCELLQESVGYYQLQLDTLTSQLMQLVEPLLLVVLGALIGSVVIAMYLPLFNLGLVMK
ncbi:MAG: type II secretion system F family protein, partial [Gammaproteobacteria bacterium]